MKWFNVHKSWLLRLLLVVTTAGLLLVSLTALWLHRTMYDTERFTDITTTAITESSSRQSVGEAIVNRAFADRAVLRNTVGPRMANLIAGLLDTELASGLIERAVERVQITLTTPRKSPVVLEISGLKQAIISVQGLINSDGQEARINIQDLPDEILLIDTNKLPNVYSYGIIILWLGPASAVVACVLMAYWIFRARIPEIRLLRLRIMLLVVMGSAVLALAIGPLVKPPFLSVSETAQARTVLSNIFDGFIRPFNQQAYALGVGALLLLIVTYVAGPAIRYIQALGGRGPASPPHLPKKKTKTIKKA